MIVNYFICSTFVQDLSKFVNRVYLQVLKISSLDDHTCSGSATLKGHQASTSWISRRAKDIIKEDPTLSANKLQKRLEKQYHIEMSYFKVWAGKKSAMNELHGTWEESFAML